MQKAKLYKISVPFAIKNAYFSNILCASKKTLEVKNCTYKQFILHRCHKVSRTMSRAKMSANFIALPNCYYTFLSVQGRDFAIESIKSSEFFQRTI